MRRSLQEIIELVIFGLIALLLGTGLLWGVGWLLDLVGWLFRNIAGLLWWLLRFLIPIVIIGGIAYALFRFFQSRSDRQAESDAAPAAAPSTIDVEAEAPAEPSADGDAGETADEAGDEASEADGGDEAGDEPGDEAGDEAEDEEKS